MSRKYKPIPFALPSVGKEEEEAVLRVLRSGWLTTGKEAKKFEQEFSAFTGASHALAVSSATAGLHLCLEALGVKTGDKVITSPYTFTSTAEVIRYLGADPVFSDIDEESFNLSPGAAAKTLETIPGIKGILPVHIGGRPAAMEEFIQMKKDRKLFLVEDAAHAFPVFHRGKFLGTWGDAGVFSFYATKTITTGEGGMVVTDNKELAERIATMRLHGIDREIWDRYSAEHASWKYSVVEAGFKYNLPDILAAIGREQLKKGNRFFRERKRIAEYYINAMKELDFLKLPEWSEEHGWHLFIVRINENRLTINRDEFVNRLQEKGIGISVHYIPLHIMPYYRKKYGFKPQDFPNTMKVYRSAFSLPIYPGLTDEDCFRITESVKQTGLSFYRRNG